MQQITITGNLTADPELRYTPSGVPVCGYNVAVNEEWTDANNVKQKKVVFFRVSTWRGQAEPCSKYLAKGSKVLVVGKMEPSRAYTKQDGTLGASLEITSSLVEFLTPKGTDASGGSSASPMDTVPTPQKATATTTQLEQEDLPW